MNCNNKLVFEFENLMHAILKKIVLFLNDFLFQRLCKLIMQYYVNGIVLY